MKVEYTENCTKVYDSYKYSDSEIEQGVKEIVATRTEASYISEWKSHNRLYKIGYQRSRTKDVDLEENIKSTYNFLYNILGR